jgi:HK97 gp10 family phage protein
MIGMGFEIAGIMQVLDKLKAQQDKINAGRRSALMKVAHLIERVTKQKCPVDTGRLRSSYAVKIISDEVVEVGTNLIYAPFVEFGTVRMHPQPHLRPAVMEAQAQLGTTFKTDIETNIGK